jgi:hypothetical protein
MENDKWQMAEVFSFCHMPFIIYDSVALDGRGLGVFSADGFYDQTLLDGFGADAQANDVAIDDSSDFLDVGLESTSGNAGDFGADTAQVLRFTAMGDLVAEGGFLTGEITNAWHR